MDESLLFLLIFGSVGFIFLIVGLIITNSRKKKEIKCTSQTTGIVKDIVRHRSYSNGTYSSTLHPVFEYTIGNQTFVKESSYGSSFTKYSIGQEVEIFYNPQNYHEYYVPGDNIPKVLGTLFTILGIIVMLLGVYITIKL